LEAIIAIIEEEEFEFIKELFLIFFLELEHLLQQVFLQCLYRKMVFRLLW
jgi:hypothetical protein